MDMDDLKETIEHFTHPHPLKLVQLVRTARYDNEYIRCYCCGFLGYVPFSSDGVSGSKDVMYACRELECNPKRYLCLSCSEVGESGEGNTLHPRHPPLKLKRSNDRGRKCNACCHDIYSELSYQCEEEKCNFETHLICAHSLKPTLSLPSHSHLLALTVNNRYIAYQICESCHSDIQVDMTFARCVPCNLNYHISCRRVHDGLPKWIMDTQRHPQHPLFLTRTNSYWSCNVCCKNKREWPGMHVYKCLDCNNFTAHLSCAFPSSSPCPFSNLITKVSVHDLVTKDSLMHKNMVCQRCKKCILGNESPVYGCQYCRLFLHETCISRVKVDGKVEESLIFSHPGYDLQRNDPLVLVLVHGADHIRCACCTKKCIGFMFQKRYDESFVLDLECTLVVPSVELIGHNHPVTLYHIGNNPKCSYLRCIQCREDFYISRSMCRLPRTIVHECHFHPLALVPRLVGNFDTNQFYCDVCEDERDPNECIYYCVECKFEAQLTCVKSEVIALCANKPEDVKFVTLQEITQEEEEKKKKVRVRDVFRLGKELKLSNIHVDKEIGEIFQAASKTTWKNSVGENFSYSNEFLSKTLYSDESFKFFIEELDSASTLEKVHRTLKRLGDEDVVRMGDYLVPFDFDEVLETLFDKYGDVGEKCTCSAEVKQYLFVGLCKALQSICKTKVEHVTKSLLVEWWAWFALGKAARFETTFFLEILERIVYAYFGIEADKYADGRLTRVRKKLREVPEEVKELRTKLAEKERELAEKERELEEAITEEEELREAAFRVKKSHLMRKCLTEAEDLACYYG